MPPTSSPMKRASARGEADKPIDKPLPLASVQSPAPRKQERRVMAAGESSLAKKDGALPPLPPMSKAQINEFIKMYFPPGFPLPK